MEKYGKYTKEDWKYQQSHQIISRQFLKPSSKMLRWNFRSLVEMSLLDIKELPVYKRHLSRKNRSSSKSTWTLKPVDGFEKINQPSSKYAVIFNSIYKNFKSVISKSIPETEYFLSSLFRLFLIWSDKYGPFVGLILTNVLPYCGGFRVSPPKALTD